jgi:thioredoxin 1
MKNYSLFVLLIRIGGALLAVPYVGAFFVAPLPIWHSAGSRSTVSLHDASTSTSSAASDLSLMRVSEIKKELQDRKVDYSDCFDKESLLIKLTKARANGPAVVDDNLQQEEEEAANTCRPTNDAATAAEGDNISSRESSSTTAAPSPPPRPAVTLADLQQRSVKELQNELASRGLRWVGLLEKKELVQAVYDALQQAAVFSATGRLTPGQVSELTEGELRQEMQAVNKAPLLVDVYATWCGPCKLMATQLQDAAKELGSAIRIAKLDSDKYEKLASELKVQGLPTLILFENGKEMRRMEGAIMKEELIEWIVEE